MNFINHSSQMRSITLRERARNILLSTLAKLGNVSYKLEHERTNNRVQFIYLHHVFPDEEQGFCQLLKNLSHYYTIISYSEAIERIMQGRIDAAYLAISFDDGFKNCLRAADILSDLGVSACFFVCPPILSETNSNTIRTFCLEQLHTPPIEFMNWKDLETLINQGHEIGGHTMTHPNLALLNTEEARDELSQSFEILNKYLGNIKHFAWPFGRFHFISQIAANEVVKAGYLSCASGERGCHSIAESHLEELCIRRDHVMSNWPHTHAHYFLAKNSLATSSRDNRWIFV